jgi:hypothetical protein
MAMHMALDTTITSTLFMDESHLPSTNDAQK